MSSMIRERLTETGVLEDLRSNQKKYCDVKESKNLVAVFEQHVFVWNDSGSCILSAEISSSPTEKQNRYKRLTLSSPPVFDVESIVFNPTGSLLALSGRNGVMIYEVPWRYGKFSSSHADQEIIIGRSWNVAENFFVYSSKIAVVQVAWHPGSHSNVHLTVLSTDNYIRTYDVTSPQTPHQVIALGSSSKNTFLSSESKISFSTCFGENSVSFDFGSPEETLVLQVNSSKIMKQYETVTVWPMYLLHGNGDVYVVKTDLVKNRSGIRVIGPLTMYPPSEDNYGYDACSILCLKTIPNSIVIASTSGVLYHSIVLDNSRGPQKNSWDSEVAASESEIALYVFERVELSVTLTEEQDDVFSHPIRLYRDVTSKNKYHCSHVSGLHSVGVPFLAALEESLENENALKLLTEESKLVSIVEHIICTKPFSQMDSIPVLGLDVLLDDVGVTLICLLASWEFVCLSLVSSFFSSLPHLLSDSTTLSKESGLTSLSLFGEQIERSLKRSVCCPFLKSTAPVEAPQQWLDLLCNVTQRFREDYIQRLSTSQALMRSRIKVLNQQKEFQLRNIDKTMDEKEALKLAAGRLAEKYEDAQASQQKLLKRLESTLQKFQQNLPYLSKAEMNMKDILLTYETKLKIFEGSLEQIKKKLKHRNDKLQESGDAVSSARSNTANLNDKQVKHVKELLTKESESISELMKSVTIMKKQIGL